MERAEKNKKAVRIEKIKSDYGHDLSTQDRKAGRNFFDDIKALTPEEKSALYFWITFGHLATPDTTQNTMPHPVEVERLSELCATYKVNYKEIDATFRAEVARDNKQYKKNLDAYKIYLSSVGSKQKDVLLVPRPWLADYDPLKQWAGLYG